MSSRVHSECPVPSHLAAVVAVAALGCAPTDPSDDPSAWDVDTSVAYRLEVSAPSWLVPSPGLPADALRARAANNNLDVELYDGRRFLAWRTADDHWASAAAQLHVVSSEDEGVSWQFEHTFALGADLREPRFIAVGGRLFLYYFEGGTNFAAFEPRRIWRTERLGEGEWSTPEVHSERGEVLWDVKVRDGVAWMGSYVGNHYQSGASDIDVFLKRSDDGVSWTDLDPARPALYTGGVSEIAFEWDEAGGLWIITRNEDGDDSGFGSQLCYAPPEAQAAWECPARCDPERYDSPKMIRHGRDLYVIARRDVGGPYDSGSTAPFEEARRQYQLDYWGRPKRTTIYRVDREARRLVALVDLPSTGDTAYPAVRRLDAHRFWVANYTSPLADPDRSWIEGQSSPEGTQIYAVTLTFVPEG